MWKKLRTTLVWLMVLATPMQGYAAATMLYCGPGHHSAATKPETAGHAGSAALHHADHAGYAEPAQISATDLLDQTAKMKCSVCASCSAAVIVSSVVVIPVFTAASAPLIAVPDAPISFITDGPSRPPRSLLA